MNNKEENKRTKLLEFIENNAKKSEFINWLNTHTDGGFSEGDDWDEINKKLKEEDGVKTKEIQLYAASLSKDHDIKNLLADVEEETKEAKRAVTKLSYLSKFKKFSITFGGAIIFEGLVFIIFALGIFFQIINLGLENSVNIYAAAIMAVFGILNIIAGLLLSTT